MKPRRMTLVLSLLFALTSCGQSGAPTPPGGGTETLAISGTVHAPAGQDVAGTVVFACFVQGEACDEARSRSTQISRSGAAAPFSIGDLSREAYVVFAWQDRNNSGAPDAGDLFTVHATSGQEATPVTPPAEGLDLRLTILEDGAGPVPVEPGVVKGVARNSQGQPLAGARIVVRNAADNRSNIVTNTDASGAYRVNVPLGSWVAMGSYPITYHGLPLCLPLEEDVSEGFWHADGAVRNFTLKISGERRFSDNSLGYWGGTLEVNTRFGGNPWGGEPLEATLRFVFEPDGPLMDGSAGERLERTGTVDLRENFSIYDLPLGRYRVEAGVVGADGSVTPLDIRAYYDDTLTNDNVIAFDEVVHRSCGAIAKSSVIVLSPRD